MMVLYNTLCIWCTWVDGARVDASLVQTRHVWCAVRIDVADRVKLFIHYKKKYWCILIIKIFKHLVLIMCIWCSPGMQATVASPAKFGKHSQIIVLIGSVSTTEHLAPVIQGFVSMHGSLQTPLKQPNLLGQSPSTWHCKSVGSKQEKEFFNV